MGNNDNIKLPPLEICKKGPLEIMSFLKELENQPEKLRRRVEIKARTMERPATEGSLGPSK